MSLKLAAIYFGRNSKVLWTLRLHQGKPYPEGQIKVLKVGNILQFDNYLFWRLHSRRSDCRAERNIHYLSMVLKSCTHVQYSFLTHANGRSLKLSAKKSAHGISSNLRKRNLTKKIKRFTLHIALKLDYVFTNWWHIYIYIY